MNSCEGNECRLGNESKRQENSEAGEGIIGSRCKMAILCCHTCSNLEFNVMYVSIMEAGELNGGFIVILPLSTAPFSQSSHSLCCSRRGCVCF